MKRTGLFLFFVFSAFSAWCQKDSAASQPAKPFLTHFQLRQSFETSDEQESPGQLQLTLPGGGKDSWLVNAATAFTLPELSSGSVTSKIVAEYHRNTALDNVQNNYQVGYNLRWFERGATNFKAVVTGNIKYVDDVQGGTNSLAATANLAGYKRKGKGLRWSIPTYLDSNKYTYTFGPYIAGQYQQFFRGSGQQTTGSILRPLGNLSSSFAINKKQGKGDILPPKMIELSVDMTVRYAVVNTTNSGEGFTKLYKAGVNYYILNGGSASVSLGANYNIGSDPLNGLKDQRFWQLALQVQI
jgi:hypothetical protein